MSSVAMMIGCLSAGAVTAGGAAVLVPPMGKLAPRVRPYAAAARARLGQVPDASSVLLATVPTNAGVAGRLFAPPLRAVVMRVGRILERRTDDSLELSLRQAGYVDVTAAGYRSRVATRVLGWAALGAVFGVLVVHSALLAVALTACGVVFGASRVRGRLERAIQDRRDRIRLELYTVNQLLAMHVRTGAGPVQATQRIVDRGSGAVVDELQAVLLALRNGIPEPEGFRRAAELTPEPAAARTYKLFAAGAERGVDLADGLRALSEDLRDARREEIRKTATKRRAAMLVPTIAVLAPVMLLFIAAPLPSIVFGSR
jgi:Flp pilus assembly protein TadB